MSDTAVPLDPKPQTSDEIEIACLLEEHKIPRAVVDELKAKWSKPLFALRDQPVIFRIPPQAEFDRLGRKKENEKFAGTADFVRRHVLYPEPEAYAALLEEYPVLFGTIADAMADLAKGKRSAEAKKL